MIEDNSNDNLSNNIDVYLLVKDNSKYLKKYFPAIRKCLEDNMKLKWIIYENGSNDDTKELIKYYFGNCESEDLKYLDEYHNFSCQNYNPKNLISLNEGEVDDSTFNKNNIEYIKSLKRINRIPYIGLRCEKLAVARENIIKLSKLEENYNLINDKWALLIDSDVIFDYDNTIKILLEKANKYPDGVMFCANSHSYNKLNPDQTIKYKNHEGFQFKNDWLINYYYDTFALDYGEYLWDPLINKVIYEKFGDSDVFEAKTAFGGVVLINKKILALSSWSTKSTEAKKYNGFKIYGTSEHYHFCDQVRRFGKIYIVKGAISHWMEEDGFIETKEKIPKAHEMIKVCLETKKLLKNYIDYSKL